MQLINCVSSYLQKVLKDFNGTAIVAFCSIPLAPSATVFSNDLALYVKDLTLLVSSISICYFIF